MEIKVSTENGRVPVTVMHVDGNIDSASYPNFQAQANELIKGGARYILVDLAHCPYVSSAGFRALNQIFKDLNSIHTESTMSEADVKKGVADGSYKSPYLKLANMSEQTRTVYETTGFDMYIDEFNDTGKAVASF